MVTYISSISLKKQNGLFGSLSLKPPGIELLPIRGVYVNLFDVELLGRGKGYVTGAKNDMVLGKVCCENNKQVKGQSENDDYFKLPLHN